MVVQTEKRIIGLSLDEGKLQWEVPTPPQSGYWNSVTPVISGQTLFITGQGKGTRAVRVAHENDTFTVAELWNNEKLGSVYNTPILKNGHLFGLSDRGKLFCLNSETGEAAWTDTQRLSNFGTLVDAGSYLVALPEKSELLIFKPSNTKYEEAARWKLAESPVYAYPVLDGNRVFIRNRETVALWTTEAVKNP